MKDDDWLKSGGSISMWPEAGSLADPYFAENLPPSCCIGEAGAPGQEYLRPIQYNKEYYLVLPAAVHTDQCRIAGPSYLGGILTWTTDWVEEALNIIES